MTEHDRHSPTASMSTEPRASVTWARSALTSALLSMAAVAPAAGVAAEPDTVQEGTVSPEEGTVGHDQPQDVETDSPGFDPGGDTEPTVDVGPESSPGDSPDSDPLESEPTNDPESTPAPLAQPESQAPEDAPVIPMEGVQPVTPPTPGFSIQPPPPPQPQSLGAEPGSRPGPRERLWAVIPVDPPAGSPAPSPPGRGASDEEGSLQTSPTSAPAVAATAPANGVQSQVEGRSPGRSGARQHTVRPGESLWTIAAGLLGPDASAMSIAAEVARLWELNRDRISSGDPDLITVGEHLRLR
jgi:resuscitation-promoting factor RpfA